MTVPTPLREDVIHWHVRSFLRTAEWRLLAGQYPKGSDDELPALNVVDLTVSGDHSPDPRRHSDGKLVPDLVAVRGKILLVIEMKPSYDAKDEAKLLMLRDERRYEFDVAFQALSAARGWHLDLEALKFVPALGFSAGSWYPVRGDFAYLLLGEDLGVTLRFGPIDPSDLVDDEVGA